MDTEVVAPARLAWRKPVFVAAFAAFVGIWGFAFWYDANRPPPEPLDATAKKSAITSCRAAVSTLAAQGPIPAPTDVTARIARVRNEDRVFVELVANLRQIHPIDGDGAKALAAFATDWQHLAEGRERYADALSNGEKSPKLVIPVDPGKAPITIRMREYAEIHSLTACTPAALQGEVVEGPRTYPRVP